MRLRFWLGRAGAITMNLLSSIGVYAVGPLPGVHYPDPDPGSESAPQAAWPPGAAHGHHGGDVRNRRPPAWHPERYCTAPPSRIERELWAALGIDVERRK